MSVFKRFDHVSIGVTDVEKARTLFLDVLGGEELADKGSSESEGFDWFTFNLAGKKIEVVNPTSPDGGVGRYMESHGEGFHHMSIAVHDLKETIAYLESKNIRILAADFGTDSFRHCYLHPKDTFGALIQLFEESDQTIADAGE